MPKVAPRTTPLSAYPKGSESPHVCRYDAPARAYERGSVLEDGTQLWFSREWAAGEREAYRREVLHQG